MILKELLALNEAKKAVTERDLRTFVEGNTDRGHNSGTAYDAAFDRTVEAVIAQALKLEGKPDSLKQAESKLAAIIEKSSYGYDRLTEAQAGKVEGTFEGWRAVVKYFGGKLDKKIADAVDIADLAD